MFSQTFRSLRTMRKLLVGLLIIHLILSNALSIHAQDTSSSVAPAGSSDQAGESKIFLPLISNGSSTSTQPNPGSKKIQEAGLLSTDGPKQDNPVLTPQTDEQTSPSEAVHGGPIKAIQCSTRKWTASQVRDLGDTVLLDANAGIIYPGALVQGKNFEDGRFTPITIPRAGGTISVQGLKLSPDAKYSHTVSQINQATVKQAVEDILSGPIQGTAANAYYDVEQTYSYEQMAFRLGLDARYGAASMKASLKIGTQEKKNYVFLKFAQVFYDVYFEDPELSTSVFRDGENFQDPENQISPGNAPLYVQKVSYGRMVFFVAESDYSAKDVEAALEGSYKGALASAKTEVGLTYQEVMARTKVYYAVIGGDAGLALQPIDSASPEDMFDKVKGFLGNKEAANFSPSNPGLPIAYTLRYLSNRNVARMSYSVVYDAKNCETVVGGYANITVHFTQVHILDDSDPFGSGEIWFDFKVYGESETPDTTRYPDGTANMDSGGWYQIDKFLHATMNENDKLRIHVTGTDNDGAEANDDLGTALAEWGADTEWGTIFPTRPDYEMCAISDEGHYCMYYQVTVNWLHEPVHEFNIISQHSGKCLDVTGASQDDFVPVQQWGCVGAQQKNQLWRLQQFGDYYQIIAVHSGKCLDLREASLDNGAIVQQWSCLGPQQTNQLWRIQSLGDVYHITAAHSGKCLSVDGAAQDNDGAIVEQWECGEPKYTNESWSLHKAP